MGIMEISSNKEPRVKNNTFYRGRNLICNCAVTTGAASVAINWEASVGSVEQSSKGKLEETRRKTLSSI